MPVPPVPADDAPVRDAPAGDASRGAAASDFAAAVLELKDVTFRRAGTQILHGVSFTVREGEHWALLGPNGAGKSTILSFCGAVTFPTSGTVCVLGEQMGHVELAALRRSIGHVNPRHPLRSPLTVRDVVLTGITGTIELPLRWRPAPADLSLADSLIDSVGLGGKAESRWPALSQGERGRALIARALGGDPRLLLLDEPSSGLDVAAREQLLETLDELDSVRPGVASVLVTHHLEELPATTTHALLLSGGTVVAAGPAVETVTTENVSAAFDHPITVHYEHGRWAARAARRR
jgi:iron complex transport system ATP-binding protein